jgi:hypothetical protein
MAFGGLHALQQGQLAVVVEVHAHAQVDLVGVGVGVELLVQTQDGVAGAISTAVNRDMKVLEVGNKAGSPRTAVVLRVPVILARAAHALST